MTDPHAPPPDLEDLFRRARLDVGEPERLARVAAKLPGRPRFPWLKLAGGGALVAALGLAGASLSRPHDLPAPASLPPVPSDTLPQASALAPPGSSPEPSPAISGSSGYQTSPAPPSSPPAPPSSRPPRQAASATGGDIMEEHALLAEARRALGSSPASALALVQQHQQRFPRGQLGVEREFLRIQALHRLGRSAEARAAGERFLRSFPRSPYAAEVERLLR